MPLTHDICKIQKLFLVIKTSSQAHLHCKNGKYEGWEWQLKVKGLFIKVILFNGILYFTVSNQNSLIRQMERWEVPNMKTMSKIAQNIQPINFCIGNSLLIQILRMKRKRTLFVFSKQCNVLKLLQADVFDVIQCEPSLFIAIEALQIDFYFCFCVNVSVEFIRSRY